MTRETMNPSREAEAGVLRRLAELAAAEAGLEAPPRVEAAVLQAFREARTVRGAPLERPASGLPLLGRGARVLAAAAAALIALMAALALRQEAPAGTEGEAEATFLPLVAGDPWDDVDAVQLVSVEVPRSALASLGWNGSPDAASPVVAELLVGQDGLARGIRFVE
jgi:hypothetical protein